MKCEVAIIGSGFSGSLLAWILAARGVSVALIDAQTHPRFAIGESSTPIADLLLRRLGQQHALPALESLSTWGSWQRDHPELACGRKRGFSYFAHQSGRPFDESRLGERSLLVAASASDATADTHWYRSDVDRFFFTQAVEAGAMDWSGHRVQAFDASQGNTLQLDASRLNSSAGNRTLQADWVIDASGPSSVLPRLLAMQDRRVTLRTCTRTSFAHYRGVRSWTDWLTERGHWADDPFDPDDAAQHHLVDDEWVWMLRFNNGITSVGWTSNGQPQMQWPSYPSLMDLMANAEQVAPTGGVCTTERLQRLFDPVAGERLLLLPGAAFSLDPLHSTGIAHGLAGVDRVARIVLESDERQRRRKIDTYRHAFYAEVELLDRLVSTAYAVLGDFERFTLACMLYFAAAIQCEEQILAGRTVSSLWNASDRDFTATVHWACDALLAGPQRTLASRIQQRLQPWNSAGLIDPTAANRYAYTATKG